MTDVITASLACGLTLSDWEKLEAGQVVDIVFTKYNQLNDDSESQDKPKTRKATQADWDAFSI